MGAGVADEEVVAVVEVAPVEDAGTADEGVAAEEAMTAGTLRAS